MPSPSRRIRHLALTSARRDALRQGERLVTEAFRTASLAEATAGRVLVVRSLDLGRLSTRQSPSAVALTLEKKMRALSSNLVHWSDSSAPQREAVLFRDESEPLRALASKLARGQSAHGWYWRAAVPGFWPSMPHAEAFRLILRRVEETRAGLAAVAELVDHLVRINSVAPLLEALEPQRILDHLDSLDLNVQPATLGATVDSVGLTREQEGLRLDQSLDGLSSAWKSALVHWVSQWSESDPRSIWLVTMALIASRPSLMISPSLRERVSALLISTVKATEHEQPSSLPPQRSTGDQPITRGDRAPSVVGDSSEEAQAMPSDEREPFPELHEPEPRREKDSDEDRDRQKLSSQEKRESVEMMSLIQRDHPSQRPMPPLPRSVRPKPTSYGGLYFVLPILESLGITHTLTAFPQWIDDELVRRVLWELADRVEVPFEDPIRDPLRSDSAPLWTAREGMDLETALAVSSWADDVRDWLCEYAELDLFELVERPGGVLTTRTHLDVIFDINDADIRVRKLGLDVNPGWVPWFGRVVTFHFTIGGRRDID